MANINAIFARISELARTMGDALQLRGFKSGGTAGQVPTKGAGGDFDWSWSDPDAGVTSWNDLEDKPSVFPPDAHSHVVDDLTNITTYDLPTNNTPLSNALDGKISTLANVTLDNGNVIDPHTYSFPDISGEFLLDSSLPLAQSHVVDLVDDLAAKAPVNDAELTGTTVTDFLSTIRLDVTGLSLYDTEATFTYTSPSAATHRTALGLGTGDSPEFAWFDPSTGYLKASGNSVLRIEGTSITAVFTIRPSSNESIDFGRAANRWKGLYAKDCDLSGNLTASGTVSAASYTLNGVAQQDVSEGASVSFGPVTVSGNISGTQIISSTNVQVGSGNRLFWSGRCSLYSSSSTMVEVKAAPTSGYADVTLRNLTASGTVTEGVYTVATTPTHVLGASIRINNATGAAIGSVVAGTGSQHVVARSNGTQWICTAIIIP